MDKTAPDVLVKPPMRAALSLTHLAHNLHNFMLAMFKTISNTMGGIRAFFRESACQSFAASTDCGHPKVGLWLLISTACGIVSTETASRSVDTPIRR